LLSKDFVCTHQRLKRLDLVVAARDGFEDITFEAKAIKAAKLSPRNVIEVSSHI
jgi:hypothetical protein